MSDRSTWNKTESSFLLLALALTIFAIAPLAYPGYFQVHSAFAPIYNLSALGNGPLEAGWTPGVATTFDPLRGDGILPYYAALPFVWLGSSPQSGVKVIFALSFLLGTAGLFVWLRRTLGPAGAALAALVYTYLPYHLATVHVRGAWGEALFLGLLPWAFATVTTADRPQKPPQTHEVVDDSTSPILYILTALIWTLLVLSQAGLTIWGLLVLVVWMLLAGHFRHDYKLLLAALGGSISGLALTFLIAGFTLPFSPINFFDHFVHPAQLFSAFWGFGASRPGWNDGLALGFGFAAVGLGMLTLFLALKKEPSDRNGASQDARALRRLIFTDLAIILALTLLLLAISATLWRVTSLHHTLAYPWQLLALIGLFLSALAGTSVKLDSRLASLPTYAALLLLTLLASYGYLEARFTQQPPGMGPLAAWDGHHLALLDYDLSAEIPAAAAGLVGPVSGQLPLTDYASPRPGDTLHLTLTWQATRPFNRNLKLFVPLLDASGQVIAQADPLAGTGAGPEEMDYFTSQWDPGELILEDVAITIPPDSPPGPYRIAFGLYNGETLERLPVSGHEEGRVILELEGRE